MKKLLIIILFFASTLLVQAQPTVTKPNSSNIVTPCLTNVPLVGNGATTSPSCWGTGSLGTAAHETVGVSGANVPLFNGTNIWSGTQSFTKNDFVLLGTSTGTLTLNSGNAGASNFIITLPAGTTDFSATGGTSQVVKQTSSGGAFTVARLACSDLSDSNTGCSSAAGTGITALTGDVTASGSGSVAATISANAVTLAKLATQATNTVLGNATSIQAVPTALTMTSCSTASSAVIWTTNTGFGCNTSITANAVAVGGITGLGTGVATALAVNVGSAGAFITFNGALGTPSSGTVTNLTGTASININGTVGATTPTTGVFTTATASTSITAPLYIGGSGTTGTQLTLQTTTGNGTTDAFAFKGGNNGATTFATLQTGSFNLKASSTYNINSTVILSSSSLNLGGASLQSDITLKQSSNSQYVGGITLIRSDTTDKGAIFIGGDGSLYMFAGAGKYFNIDTTGTVNIPTGNLVVTGTGTFTALANTATTSSVCYNTGTGLLTYNGTVGTCTVSTIAAKNLTKLMTPKEGLDIVLAMQPWWYTLKEGLPTYQAGEEMGLIAEYAEKVEPRMVAKNPDGSVAGVRYEQYTAALTAAIKQLKADNDNLKNELNELKRKVH